MNSYSGWFELSRYRLERVTGESFYTITLSGYTCTNDFVYEEYVVGEEDFEVLLGSVMVLVDVTRGLVKLSDFVELDYGSGKFSLPCDLDGMLCDELDCVDVSYVDVEGYLYNVVFE